MERPRNEQGRGVGTSGVEGKSVVDTLRILPSLQVDMQNKLLVVHLLGFISTEMLFKATRLDKSMSEGEEQAVAERI